MVSDKSRESFSLIKGLGLYTTVAIVVGAMIGSGIFKKPAVMAEHLGSPEWMLAIWIIAGLVTLTGALTNAEIAGMITETGGQYEYFRVMYGDFVAYLYGWAIFAIIQTGSIASITYVFSHYTEHFFYLPHLPPEIVEKGKVFIPYIGTINFLENAGRKLLTISVIAFLTLVNYFGVAYGGRVSAFFTTMKILAIMIIVVLGFALGNGDTAHFTQDSPAFDAASAGLISGIAAALAAAFWSYDGWNNVTYLSGEIKQPQKTLPKALFLGTVIVIAVYLVINLAFLYIVPAEEMAGSERIASDAAQKAIGSFGAGIVAAAVMISTFGTSNGTIMASARVYFKMSQRNMFFSAIGKVHPKHRTPANSLMLQLAWTALLVITGTFDILTDMLIFVSWIFYAAGAYGVFVLRKKMPDTHRPYKVIGYPYLPAIFVVFALAYVVFTLYNDISNFAEGKTELINSVFGLLLVALGIPLYLYFRMRDKAGSGGI